MSANQRKPKTQSKSSRDYEQLGRMLAEIYESGYVDKGRTYKMSFVKGLLGGLGGAIGATVVLAVIVWLLSLLGHVPFLERIIENITDTVKSQQ